MSEIKRCPFCGGKATIGNLLTLYMDEMWFVRCTECMANITQSKKDEVIKAWNTRVEQVAIKRGKWLEIRKITIGCGYSGTLANCSVCGEEVVLCDYDNYCPVCGADMVGDSE